MRGLAGRLAGCLLASIGVLSFPPSLARADTLTIALVKLGDVSGYRGAWRIDRQITRLLSEALLSLNGVSLAPASDVSEAARQTIGMPDESLDPKKLLMIGRAVGADLAVGGTVDKLSLEGQGVVSYRAGGGGGRGRGGGGGGRKPGSGGRGGRRLRGRGVWAVRGGGGPAPDGPLIPA